MSTEILSADKSRSRGRAVRYFVRHYLEMVVAMLVGMVVLGPVWNLVWPGWSAVTEVHVLGMATNMAIGHGRLDGVPQPLPDRHRRDVGRDVRAVPRAAGALLGRGGLGRRRLHRRPSAHAPGDGRADAVAAAGVRALRR